MTCKTSNYRADLFLKKKASLLVKASSILVLGCYVLGIVITNFHLSSFSIHDFSIVRARYILTGLCFIIYLVSPLVVLIASAEASYLCYRHVPKFTALVFIASFIFIAFLFPSFCQYFFVPVIQAPAASFMAAFSTYWYQYYSSVLPLLVLGWIAPVLLIYLFFRWPNNHAYRLGRFCNIAVVLAFIGAASQLANYSWRVHPNISLSMGGGQPLIAEVILNASEICPVKNRRKANETEVQSVESIYPLAVIWHQDENYTYLTFLTDLDGQEREWRSVFSIKNDEIAALRYMRWSARFDIPNKIARVRHTNQRGEGVGGKDVDSIK